MTRVSVTGWRMSRIETPPSGFLFRFLTWGIARSSRQLRFTVLLFFLFIFAAAVVLNKSP